MDVAVESFLKIIESPNREAALNFWADLENYIPEAKGSTKSHQAWEGGYRDHVQETLNVAIVMHHQLGRLRPLPFSLASAVLVLFLHDCEKPFRHATDAQLKKFPWIKKRPVKSDKSFQEQLIKQYGFKISEDEANALRYVEKVSDSDYIEGERVDGPLAAFCHCCDTISARIWYDYPKRES